MTKRQKGGGASPALPQFGGITMIWIENWLFAVIQLFDHTLRAMMAEAFFSVLLELLVFLVAFGLMASLIRTGRRGR